MCMCGWVKNRIATCEKFIFWCEKGYEWILAIGSPKTYYSGIDGNVHVEFLAKYFDKVVPEISIPTVVADDFEYVIDFTDTVVPPEISPIRNKILKLIKKTY